MKKLILILLIFALFLTGCSTPAPAAGDQNSENNQSNESSDNNQNAESAEKTPATQITNEGEPQDENDDFLFVFKGKSGYFARGERMELEIEITNNGDSLCPGSPDTEHIAGDTVDLGSVGTHILVSVSRGSLMEEVCIQLICFSVRHDDPPSII